MRATTSAGHALRSWHTSSIFHRASCNCRNSGGSPGTVRPLLTRRRIILSRICSTTRSTSSALPRLRKKRAFDHRRRERDCYGESRIVARTPTVTDPAPAYVFPRVSLCASDQTPGQRDGRSAKAIIAIEVAGVAFDARDGAIETLTSGNRYHQGFGDKAFRAFESPRIETGSFRLDDPQRHCVSAFLALRALEPVREHCLSPIRSCSTFVACRGLRSDGTALRKSYVRKVTDVSAAITKEFFENEICAMYATRRNSIACPSFGVIQ